MKIAIVGYGNLGRGVETALLQQPDMEAVGVFTRRDPASLTSQIPAYPLADLPQHEVDVAILCGGSATDLIEQSPDIVRHCNIVDSFDTHARIPEHFAHVDAAAKESDHAALISTGWDPGLFSLMRVLGLAVLPNGTVDTFWGKGVSQGHSDAIRRIPGVVKAVQYTIPKEEAVARVEQGQGGGLTARDKHLRECFVVAASEADQEAIRHTIVTMPNYFADYDTLVHFIDEASFDADHTAMPHGGQVIRHGHTSEGTPQVMKFSLDLASNPEFTASVNVACARALYRAYQEGKRGCMTIFDLPLAYLLPISAEELRAKWL
ncbi:diaminopimelate dehydrogenase [Peptococcus simiae]|uniref:diaminopimelate dehydrogenase n=1 Tax=Peptococcus simiae TaxID=1643805 RepID=UPI00397F475E